MSMSVICQISYKPNNNLCQQYTWNLPRRNCQFQQTTKPDIHMVETEDEMDVAEDEIDVAEIEMEEEEAETERAEVVMEKAEAEMQMQELKMNLVSIGDWVSVVYEGEVFVGKVILK